MSKINFLAFGGLDEKQNAFYSLTIDGDIYVINCGISLPPSSSLGIKKIIPDYSWIIANKTAIKGIFIGNASYVNFGGLQYLNRFLPNVPIYTSDINASIIITYFKNYFANLNYDFSLNIKTLNIGESQQIGQAVITLFKVSTYIPHSVGFVFNTKDGAIIYIDDFVLNSTLSEFFTNDYFKINSLTNNKNLILIVGAGLVGQNKGFTFPEAKIMKYYQDILEENISSRIIFASYDDDIYRILVLINLCSLKNRPIMIYGKNFNNVLNKLLEKKIFGNKEINFIDETQLLNNPNAIILISESLENFFNKITKIVNDEDPKICLIPSDSFVYSNNTIFGYEKAEAELLDNLHRLNISKIYRLPKNILPLKASNEDHKFLLNLLRPKYIIPVSGLYMNLISYKKCAASMGINRNSIFILDNGEQLSIDNTQVNLQKKYFKFLPQFINEQDSLDNESSSIFERELMRENGAVLVSLLMNNETKKILKFNFDAVGVLNINEESKILIQDLNNELIELIDKFATVQFQSKSFDIKEYKHYIKKIVGKIFEKKTGKKPLVASTIVFLRNKK